MEEKEDVLAEKREKILPENGINNLAYDVSEPWVDAIPLPEEETEGLTFTYDFTGDEAAKAIKLFQKKMIYKKNMIYTCIFLIIEILYLASLVKNPDDTMAKILSTVCLIAVLYIWYMPYSHLKNIKKATDSMETRPVFKLTVGERGFVNYDEEEKGYLIPYSDEKVRVLEDETLFTIIISKEKCFVVPKRCLSETAVETMTEKLKRALKERYEKVKKKR